ncbi:MAG: DUF4870 domain-containing protein [Pyrinomonadaceae bacterium]|nr:DUF4870 domain-containing protein [Pyrinomonadaceae bacterium]
MQPPPPPVSTNTLPGAEPGSKSAIGLEGNAAGALAYLSPFNIVFAIIEKENRFVRFNAFQSLFTGLMLIVLEVVMIIVGAILSIVLAAARMPAAAVIFWILIWAVIMIGVMVFLALIIMAGVKAYQRQMFKIPIVGNWAESIARK